MGGFGGPRYLPCRVFACADFQRLEQGTAGLAFLSGRQFLGGSRPQSGQQERRPYKKSERE